MSLKQYQFLCDNCGYKRFSDGTDLQDLVEVKTADIPRGVPYIDPVTKKLVSPPVIKQIKRFKCPTCGFVIKARKLEEFKEIKNETDITDGSKTSTKGPPF